MKQNLLKTWLVMLCMLVGIGSAWADTATYTWTYSSSKFNVSASGDVPTGSSATLTSTYSSANQLTGGKAQTFTLTGYDDCTITGVSINMKRTSSASAKANVTVSVGGTEIGSVSNQTLTTSQTDYGITVTSTKVGTGKNVVITVNAAANSIYVYNYVITYTASGKTALGTATNLTESNVTDRSATLSWDAVANATSYKVKVGTTEYDTNTNSYNITGLDCNTEYNWSVKALAGGSASYSDGNYSASKSFTTGDFVLAAGTYNILPNNIFFNCDAFTTKPTGFTTATGTKYGVTIEYTAASNAYINGSQCRAYSGTKLKFTAPTGYNFQNITFTADGANWDGTHAATSGTMTDSKTWDGDINEVTITFGGKCHITNISVTYAAATVKTLASISVTGQTTNFHVGDDFSFGGTVMANYEEDGVESINVTSKASFTGYDMSVAGNQTVTVSYTENGVTKDAQYDINVRAYEYDTLEELVADCTPTGTAREVTVMFEDKEITELYITGSGYRNGVYVMAGEQKVLIYCRDVPETWIVGGKVSGALTCDWKLYSGNWELCPTDWNNITYTAPAPTYSKMNLSLKAENEDGFYATFSSDKVTFWPENYVVSAVGIENNALYTVSNDEAFEADIVEIGEEAVSGYYVPANTGVLVYSVESKATYYNVEGVTPSTDVEAVNMLCPSNVAMTGDKLFYKLAYGDWDNKKDLGFFWGADNGAAFDTWTGGAYLAVPTSIATAKGFTFDGAATAISNVNAEAKANGAAYNLAGQRVNANAKGIIIMNGYKFINK